MSVRRTIPVINKKGLHARASRKLAELALNYESTRIIVRREESEAKTTGGIILPDAAKKKPTSSRLRMPPASPRCNCCSWRRDR